MRLLTFDEAGLPEASTDLDVEEANRYFQRLKSEATEQEIKKIQNDEHFEEIRDIWSFEREEDDLQKLDSDPEYLIQEYHKQKSKLGPGEEEREELEMKARKEQKLNEKRERNIRQRIKMKAEMGHSTDEEAMEYIKMMNLFPEGE